MHSYWRSFLFFIIFSFSLLQVVYCNECRNTYHIYTSESDSHTSEINCVDVILIVNSTSVPYKNCTYLSHVLNTLNSLQCAIEMVFHPGVYTLSGYDIIITNSINMTAVKPGVVINCEISEREVAEIRTQLWVNSTLTGQSYAVVSGITFQSCAYSLRFDYLEEVTIDNCIFSILKDKFIDNITVFPPELKILRVEECSAVHNVCGFRSSAVDIYNSLHVEVTNSKFRDNYVSTLNDRFRADAAGLSVAYNFPIIPVTQPMLVVEGCRFEHNRAMTDEPLFSQIDKVFNQKIYPARGGGMCIIITEYQTNITNYIRNCVFYNNSALAFGGGLYVVIDGDGTNHSIFLTDSQFQENHCDKGGGGGLFIGYVSANLDGVPSIIDVRDSLFDSNAADSSGGALVLQTHNLGSSNYVIFRRCNFTHNFAFSEGAALVFGSLFNVQSRRRFYTSQVDSCIFSNNNSTGGTFIAAFTNINFTGYSMFSYNHGLTVKITGCLVQVQGNVTFTGNRGDVVGSVAMYLSAFGQIKIYRNCYLTFKNNNGTIGAAIHVQLQQFPLLYSSHVSNPLCFIHYEDPSVPPVDWQPGLIHFSGNSALLGSAIYISYVDLCSYYSKNESDVSSIFDIQKFPKWPIFEFSDNINTLHEKDQQYYIQTPAFGINTEMYENNEIKLRPGEERNLNLTGLDQFGNPTFFITRIIDKDESFSSTLSDLFNVSGSFEPPANYSVVYNEKNRVVVRFDPSLMLVYPNTITNIVFDLELPVSEENSGDGFVETLSNINKEVLIEIQNTNGKTYDSLELNLTVLPCKGGYNLQLTDSNIATCVCNGAQDNPFAVLDCDDKKDTIILRNGYWAGYNIDVEGEDGIPHLDIYTCPVPYCQCQSDGTNGSCIAVFYSDDPNGQCHPPREGCLCGACGNGTTITILRFLCKESCEDQQYTIYYATIILIIVDSVVIILALLASIKFSIRFPHSMRAIIFYIQTVYIATEFFPVKFWNSRQYMLYLSNLLGLYFPVDFCFIPGADTILSFIPRFIPSILLFIISTLFLFSKRGRIGMWHGVWALVQVTYAPLVYTCVMLLHCPRLPNNEGFDDVTRWFLDGTIKCFDDSSHIILGTIAMIFLLGLVLIIPLIFFLVLFEWHPFIQEKYPILINVIKALKTGYQPHRKWWAVIDISRRLLLIGIVIGLPGRTVTPVYILAFFFALHLYFQPYKYPIQNILEAIVLLNYIILFVLRFPQTLLDALDQYTGTMVPSEYGREIPSSFNIVIFYTLFFNIPIFIGVCVCVSWIIHRIWRYYKQRRAIKEEETRDRRKPHETDMDRYYDHDSIVMIDAAGKQISFSDIDDMQLYEEQ